MSRRLKALGTIIRLRDRELKAHAAELVELQGALASVGETRAELHRMRVEECSVTDPAAMGYVAGFLARVHREDGRLEQHELALASQVEIKRDQVLDIWKDGKTAQHLADAIRKGAKTAAEKAEQAIAEERAASVYARRRKSGAELIL